MKLWRRIVSVLAGTMIAAGGVLAVAAIVEVPQPSTSGATPAPETFDVPAARASTQADAQVFAAWAGAAAQNDAPTHADRMTAALGADGLGEFTGASSPSGAAAFPPASSPAALDATVPAAQSASADSLRVVGAANSTPPGQYVAASGTVYRLSTPITLFFDSFASTDLDADGNATAALDPVAPGVLFANRTTTDAVTAGEPTDDVARKASVSDPPAAVANWTASAEGAILAHYNAGALEKDTLNVSLASQAMRDTNPAAADALNAELRFRQRSDGSFGGIRDTAEAARALAQGAEPDRGAAVRALNWLDAQGSLAPDLAVLRLRAHAFDGLLLSKPDVRGAPAAPAQSFGGGFSPVPDLGAVPGKAALGLWLLVGGIGLSLSLVTVDALKGARQRLYDTIRASPGLHVNELRRRLHMSPSSIEYHLAVLVGAGLVVAEDDGRYKRYYANGAGLGLNPRSPNSRNALGALRRPHAVTLVRALADRDAGATARELSRGLAIHESAAARRLSHLEDAGILVSERQGRARMYRVRDRLAALKALSAVQEAPPVVAAGPVPDAAAPQPASQPVSAGMPSH